jgi:hypothetical protein
MLRQLVLRWAPVRAASVEVGRFHSPVAHGQRYELPGGAFFALHEQRIVRVTNYYNLQDWLRQIERREP